MAYDLLFWQGIIQDIATLVVLALWLWRRWSRRISSPASGPREGAVLDARSMTEIVLATVAVAAAAVAGLRQIMLKALNHRAAAEIADRKLIVGLVDRLTETHSNHMTGITAALGEIREGMAAERQVLELIAQKVLVHGGPVRRPKTRK